MLYYSYELHNSDYHIDDNPSGLVVLLLFSIDGSQIIKK